MGSGHRDRPLKAVRQLGNEIEAIDQLCSLTHLSPIRLRSFLCESLVLNYNVSEIRKIELQVQFKISMISVSMFSRAISSAVLPSRL